MKPNAHHRVLNGVEVLYAPQQQADYTAYWVNEYPQDTTARLDRYKDKFDNYCTATGQDIDSLEMRHRLNRSLFKILSAPLVHLVEVQADKKYLKASDPEGKLDIDMYADGLPLTYQPSAPHAGAYNDYLQIESAVNTAAATTILDTITDNKQHPYRPVWDAFASHLPAFVETESQVRGWEERSSDPYKNIVNLFANIGEETMLPLLMQAVLHYRQLGATDRHIAALLMSNTEQLSWSSTTSRNFISSVFPPASETQGSTPECPYKPSGKIIFDSSIPKHFWARQDLSGGPRETTGFCPAGTMVELRAPTRRGRSVVDAVIYHAQWGPRHLSRIRGTGAAAELHTIRSVSLLSETVLAP